MLCDSENVDVSATRLSARVVSFAESCFRKASASAKSEEDVYAPVFDDGSDDEVADGEEAEVVEKQRRFQQRLESRL